MFAEHNLQLWELNGKQVVENLKAAVRQDYGTKEDANALL